MLVVAGLKKFLEGSTTGPRDQSFGLHTNILISGSLVIMYAGVGRPFLAFLAVL